MTDKKIDAENFCQQLKGYDYVRFTATDFNGIPRGKLLPARNAHKFVHSGTGIFGGRCLMQADYLVIH